MENAVEALKMAAAFLIFIIAIGTSFSLFGTAKETADSIITMRDKQAYLEAAELDGGILYTSSSAIQGETGLTEEEVKTTLGVTKYGDRIVNVSDVFSTIYRYAIENYSVTIIKDNKVIARYDTATESYIKYYNLYDKDNFFEKYGNEILNNVKTIYCPNPKYKNSVDGLKNLYNSEIPWLGNPGDINKRINLDISGGTDKINNVDYQGKNLKEELGGRTIVEVTNEIDRSKYLKDENDKDTSLLQQYNMPTIEIVYIVL